MNYEKPNLAILLFGISYQENFHHYSNKYVNVSWEISINNYKQYIFSFFEQKYNIDFFFCTNDVIENKRRKLLIDFKPQNHQFVSDAECKNYCKYPRNYRIKKVVEMCLESSKTYEMILITRFDLLFQIPFQWKNIDLQKINLVTTLETNDLICDNFYLLPQKFLKSFLEIINKQINNNNNFHCIKKDIEDICPINFINQEKINKNCLQISFYRFGRYESQRFTKKYMKFNKSEKYKKIICH